MSIKYKQKDSISESVTFHQAAAVSSERRRVL